MEIISRLIPPLIVFVLTLASGFWLSQLGKPYNQILFNVHKLIALGAVVLAVIQVLAAFRMIPISALLIGLTILAGLSVVALFASGALMSAGKANASLFLLIHQVAPVLAALSLAGIFYWMVRA